MLLDGIHVPLTTPFYPDGRLNLRKLEHNVDRYSRTPAAGMVVTGLVGEGLSLSDRETVAVWEAAIGAAAPEKVMSATVLREGVLPALELIEAAARLGFDTVLVRQPRGLGMAEAKTYFRSLADRAALPVVLVSDRGGMMPLEVIGELAEHAEILGIVDDGERAAAIRSATAKAQRQATVTTVFAAVTGRMVARASAPLAGAASYIGVESLAGGGTATATPVSGPGLKTRVRETGFQVLGGTTASILVDLRGGAVGAIPMMAACAPQACFEVFAGWKDGDAGLAEEKQARLLPAAARIEDALGVAGVKYACDLNGYFGGRPRLPLVMCSGNERQTIEEQMQGMRN